MLLRVHPLACAILGCALVMLWMGPASGLIPPLYRYNTSVSVPPGGYVLTLKWPPERGDIIMLRNPKGFRLPWLLKRVEGVGGDRFCWNPREKRHYINERPMPQIPPEARKLKIPTWRGCRVLGEDELAGFGDVPLAYGSQYIGPVKLSQIWGVYRKW